MAADAAAVSAIPPGVLVTWAQRNDQVMVGVELPGCTSAECDFADSGVVQLRARSGVDGAETRLTLALRGAIVAADCASSPSMTRPSRKRIRPRRSGEVMTASIT